MASIATFAASWNAGLNMPARKTNIEKADLLGERLVGGASEAVAFLAEELGNRCKVGFLDATKASQFIIEIIAFYMHMIDRMAFALLGSAEREAFGDRLVLSVLREALRELGDETSRDDFGPALRETYNRRQVQYARYKVPIPPEGEPLMGTLNWEFSKILFGFLDTDNPAVLMFLSLLVAETTKTMLAEALKVEEVLLG